MRPFPRPRRRPVVAAVLGVIAITVPAAPAIPAHAAADLPPVITVPDDITVDATSPGGAVVTYEATALDDLDGPITPTCTPPSGSFFEITSQTVVCTATDSGNNIAEAAFRVTVRPVPFIRALIGPGFATTSITMLVTAESPDSTIETLTAWFDTTEGPGIAVSATLGTSTVSTNATFDVGGLSEGRHTLLVRATDAHGVTSPVSAHVFLVDRTAPTLAPTVTPNPAVQNRVATAAPNASDSGAGLATASCAAPDTSTVGAHTVTCTATDRAGNTATAPASYTVVAAALSADLRATVVGPSIVRRSARVSEQVKITNLGPRTADRVNITLTFDARRLAVVDTGGGIRIGDSITWVGAALPSGRTRTVTVRFRATARIGTATLRAVVTSATPDPSLSNNAASHRVRVFA